MKNLRFTLVCAVALATTLSATSQEDLSQQLSLLKNNNPDLVYVDSSGKGYDTGEIGGMIYDILFSSVRYDRKTGSITVTGITTAFYSQKDTLGFCCVDYFLARPVEGTLTHIRKLGTTNDVYTGDTAKPCGYFYFSATLIKKDRLYFSASGRGLKEYSIGKL